jgi:hypothetical protein
MEHCYITIMWRKCIQNICKSQNKCYQLLHGGVFALHFAKYFVLKNEKNRKKWLFWRIVTDFYEKTDNFLVDYQS